MTSQGNCKKGWKTLITKQENRLQLLLFFLYIYMRCSLVFLDVNEGVIGCLIVLLMLVYQLIVQHRMYIQKSYTMIFLIMTGLISISCIVNRNFSNLDLGVLLQWLVGTFVVSTFRREDFVRCYVKVLYVIAGCSLVGFVLGIVAPGIVARFPTVTSMKWFGGSSSLRNMFLCIVDIDSRYQRNYGIFYEPGMFAFYLNLAIYFLLFSKKKLNIRFFIVLVLALLTTTSTNGYISLAILMIAFYLKSRRSRGQNFTKKQKNILALAVVTLLIYAIFYFIRNPDRWLFLVSKLGELNSKSTEGSGFERIRAVSLAFEAFSMNPLFGISVTGVSEFSGSSITTFSPIQWFATYGILYGAVCNYAYGKVVYDKRENAFLVNCILLLFTFSMILTQNITSNGVVVALLYYSIENSFKFNERKSYDIGNYPRL